MRHTCIAIVLVSCAKPPLPIPAEAERRAIATDLADFEAWWLAPSRIAPPTIDFVPVEQSVGGNVVTVTPIRAEEEDWNRWPGPTHRLFNNRAGLLFDVRIDGEAAWIPVSSRLNVNELPTGLPAVATPDDLLLPLLRAALLQEQWALDGSLVERTRAAGPYRAAYLQRNALDPDGHGIVGFQLPDPELHVTSANLTLVFRDASGLHSATWEFD